MSQRRKGFALDQHRAMGARLGLIRDELVELDCNIVSAYPKNETSDLAHAIKKLDNIRSYLDDQLAKEYPGLGDQAFLNIYYGDLSGARKRGC
jgi:hypothetical protein